MKVSQIDRYKSRWLKAAQLQGKAAKVQVDHAFVEEVGKPPQKEEALILSFIGKDAQLILNKVNAAIMVAMFGDETENWSGKEIILYPTKVTAFGENHDVIRIKAVPRPEEENQDEDIPVPDDEWREEDVDVDAIV